MIKETDTRVVRGVLAAMNCGYGTTVIGKYPEMLEQGIPASLACDGAN